MRYAHRCTAGQCSAARWTEHVLVTACQMCMECKGPAPAFPSCALSLPSLTEPAVLLSCHCSAYRAWFHLCFLFSGHAAFPRSPITPFFLQCQPGAQLFVTKYQFHVSKYTPQPFSAAPPSSACSPLPPQLFPETPLALFPPAIFTTSVAACVTLY